MNSIMMPAVIVNQMAANTGAVVRNFFMAKEKGWMELTGESNYSACTMIRPMGGSWNLL